MGFNQTRKVNGSPIRAPTGDEDTLAPVFARAHTKRVNAAGVGSRTTRKGVIPAVLIIFATPTGG